MDFYNSQKSTSLDENLIRRIDEYLAENFVELDIKFSASDHISLIDRLLAKFDYTFSNYLRDLIKQKGMTDVEVYKKAHLDRRIFSKLRNNRSYKPSERTIWAIAFAMELNIDEAEELMNQGGFAFSEYNKQDLIIKYCFENKIYDLFTVNEILDHYGYRVLGD